MRLIDADALVADDRPGFNKFFSADDIRTAPTVCCEECGKWAAHEPPNTSGWGTCRDSHAVIEGRGRLFTPPDFGCAYFERRTP